VRSAEEGKAAYEIGAKILIVFGMGKVRRGMRMIASLLPLLLLIILLLLLLLLLPILPPLPPT